MKEYVVVKREVHLRMVEIEAEDKAEAISMVRRGEGDVVDGYLEYSHDMRTDLWTVEEQ